MLNTEISISFFSEESYCTSVFLILFHYNIRLIIWINFPRKTSRQRNYYWQIKNNIILPYIIYSYIEVHNYTIKRPYLFKISALWVDPWFRKDAIIATKAKYPCSLETITSVTWQVGTMRTSDRVSTLRWDGLRGQLPQNIYSCWWNIKLYNHVYT